MKKSGPEACVAPAAGQAHTFIFKKVVAYLGDEGYRVKGIGSQQRERNVPVTAVFKSKMFEQGTSRARWSDLSARSQSKLRKSAESQMSAKINGQQREISRLQSQLHAGRVGREMHAPRCTFTILIFSIPLTLI